MTEGIIQSDIFAYRQVNDGYEPLSWSETDYYKNKQITFHENLSTSNRQLELIVFNNAKITESQIQLIRDFACNPQFANLIHKSGVHSILINDEVPASAPDREDAGLGLSYADYIMLTPKALTPKPHRVSNTVDRISGTLVHEFMEGTLSKPVQWQLQLDWARDFGFGFDEQTGEFSPTNRPDLCVTDYAKQAPNEDICDSAVAYFFDRAKLNAEKANKLASVI